MCQPKGDVKRVYTQIQGSRFANPTNVGMDGMGNYFRIKSDPNVTAKPVASCAANGNPIMPESIFRSTIQAPVAQDGFLVANTQVSGQQKSVRLETVNSAGGFTTYSLTLTSAASGNNRFILGDGAGTYALIQNPGATVINCTAGTFGVGSAAQFNTRTSLMPFRVTSTQYIASVSTVFSTAKVTYFSTQPSQDNVKTVNVNLQNLVSAEQFNPTIQVDKNNYIFAPNTGLDITLPPSVSLTLIFTIQSQADVSAMSLLNS